MNKEDFVSFEVAKLLKEKGFNEPCTHFYCKMHDCIEDTLSNSCRFKEVTYKQLEEGDFLLPTLYQAAKWLRKKGLFIEIHYYNGDYYMYDILTIPEHDLIGLSDRPYIKYKSYEEVLNAGILEALKLI